MHCKALAIKCTCFVLVLSTDWKQSLYEVFTTSLACKLSYGIFFLLINGNVAHILVQHVGAQYFKYVDQDNYLSSFLVSCINNIMQTCILWKSKYALHTEQIPMHVVCMLYKSFVEMPLLHPSYCLFRLDNQVNVDSWDID